MTTEAICLPNYTNASYDQLSRPDCKLVDKKAQWAGGPTATCPLTRGLSGIAHRCHGRTRQPGVDCEALREPLQLPRAPALVGLTLTQAAAACHNGGGTHRAQPLPVTVRCLRWSHHDRFTWRVYDSINNNNIQDQMKTAHVYIKRQTH